MSANRPAHPEWFKTTLAVDRSRTREPRLIKVTDRVYSASGYAISNVSYVITGNSVVVIDTTESPAAARASFAEFRRISQLPVSYIIYTHFHGDHIRGANVFHTPTTKVIAQKQMLDEIAKNNLLLPYRKRLTAHQFGFPLKDKKQGSMNENEPENGYVPPDITFDEQYCFEEGGVKFELSHTLGETFDHLMVWLPEDKILFPGDLFYYNSFPMLSNPMRPDRPVWGWVESLERMRTLRPNYLVPSHGPPLQGADEIDLTLANYAKAIRYVHDETVRCINEGLTLEETRQQVQLPEELARLPYLQPYYGKVEWSVNGIFRQYTGWYSFNPKDLNPSPPAILTQALLEACGGAAPLIRRAQRALSEGQDQLVLELTDIVLSARPHNRHALSLRVAALRRLYAAAKNGVERNIYRTAARMLLSVMTEE